MSLLLMQDGVFLSCIFFFGPVTSSSMHGYKRGKNANQKQNQHHVFRKSDILLLNPRRPSAFKEIIFGIESPTPETSTCSWFIEGSQRCNMMLVDDPCINTQLKIRV